MSVITRLRSPRSVLPVRFHSQAWNSTTTKGESTGASTTSKEMRMHQEMKQVLGASSTTTPNHEAQRQLARAAAAKEQVKKKEFRQYVLNVAFSFMTLVLAAQAVKSAHDRRKMENQRDEAVKETKEKTKLLKQICSEAAVDSIVEKLVLEINEDTTRQHEPSKSSWFGSPKASYQSTVDISTLQGRFKNIISKTLSDMIGDGNQFEEERARQQLERLQSEAVPEWDKLLLELQKEAAVETKDGATVVKKQVFRM